MKIADFLRPDDVVLDLAVSTKPLLLRVLAERGATALGGGEATILLALGSREELGSTGIGRGIAIPHCSPSGLSRPFALLVRLAAPIDFDAIDDEPVDIVFLLLSPEDRAQHLKLLSSVARQLRTENVAESIRRARSVAAAYTAMISPGSS